MPISTTANYANVGPIRLSADVPNGGTLSVPYPTGTTQADYTGANAGPVSDNMVTIAHDTLVGADKVSFAYGASNITVTNNTGFTWSAAPRGVTLGPAPIHFGLPRANAPAVLNTAKGLLPGPAAAAETFLPASGGTPTDMRGRPGSALNNPGTGPTLGGLFPTVATLIVGQAAGVPITSILGAPAGVTPTFTPANSADAGKVSVTGTGAMARLVMGSTAASVGTITGTLAAAGVNPTTITISAVALPTSVLLESFDTFDNSATGGTTYGTGAIVALDTADKVQGTASIDVKADSAVTTAGIGYDRTPTTPNIDPTAIGVVALRMKVVDETQLSQASGQLFRGGNAGSLSFNEVFKYPTGWQWQAKDTSGFPSAFLTSGSGPVRRRFGTAGSGPSREIKFDGAYYGAKGITKVGKAFEDGYTSQQDVGAPACKQRGLPFDMHVENAMLTGGGTPGTANQRLTVAQVAAMIQQYGMHVYSQGDGLDVRSSAGNYANPAAVVAMYDSIKATLISRGWGDARTTKHISYPSIGGNAMDQAIVDALVAAGYLSGRGGQGQPHFTRFGPDCKIMNRPSTGMAFNTTAATMLAGLDAAIAIGADWHFHIHDISDNGSAIGPKTSEYLLLLDGIAQRRDAGLCAPMHLADIMDIVYAGSAPA